MEPIHVDHSVPGAYGFIIYTSQGPIGYTGDIRLHGTVPEMTKDFIERAKNEKLIALIIEGTRIADEMHEESEQMVFQESQKIISTTNRLTLADFNFKDVDRLRTFYNIAKENDRKLVVKMNDMYFLKHLSKDPKLNVPDIEMKISSFTFRKKEAALIKILITEEGTRNSLIAIIHGMHKR